MDSDGENSDRVIKYQTYLKHREHLREIQKDSQEKFDKAIFYLSSGAIGLSVSASDKLPATGGLPAWWLLGSWVLFLLSIASVVFSYFLSSEIHGSEISWYDDNWNKDTAHAGGAGNLWLRRVNQLSLLLFCLGAACFVSFAYQSIEARNMETKRATVTEQEKGLQSNAPPRTIPSQSTTGNPGSQTGATQKEVGK